MPDTGKIKTGNDFKVEDRACVNRPIHNTADCVDVNDGPTVPFASGSRVNADVDI